MKIAASDGCPLCGQFLYSLEDMKISKESTDVGVVIVRQRYFDRSVWMIDIGGFHAEVLVSVLPASSYRPASFEYCRLTNIDDDTPRMSNTINQRDPQQGLPLIKTWLHNCLSHEKCHVAEKLVLPTRLIYVGDEYPRFVSSNSIEGFPKYATLSHCVSSLNIQIFPVFPRLSLSCLLSQLILGI
jgi:hypothetical protein